MSFSTPILFLIFNRPDTTEQVFAKIKEIKPKYLYVAADGPRENRNGEKELCEQTRKIVIEAIDWDCEVKTLFRDKNLGCGKAVSSAITWFFDNVEEGIILEDDILTSIDFFFFCSELLKYYRNEENVYSISGSNFLDGKKYNEKSYYFTRYPFIWGWATWKRAWKKYDYNMKELSDFVKSKKIEKIFDNKAEQIFWTSYFEKAKDIDTWDFQWSFTVMNHDGCSIAPCVNLTKNIGFGPDATHTKNDNPKISAFVLENISKIKYRKNIEVNKFADRYTFENYYMPIKSKSKESRFINIISRVKKKFGL